MAETAAIKPKQAKNKKYMLVSYGRMNTLSWFEHHESNIPKVPSRVVVKTERGLELGQIVGQSCPYRGGQFRLSPDQVKKYFIDSEIDLVVEEAGKFIRYATADDISEEKHLRKISEEELKCCRRFVEELHRPMKIVGAEHIFGGERLMFSFMSYGRVS